MIQIHGCCCYCWWNCYCSDSPSKHNRVGRFNRRSTSQCVTISLDSSFILWKYLNAQHIALLCTDLIVYNTQYINTWCSDNWRSFSSQNYFDPSGMFITFVVSLPLAIISLIALVLGLYNTAQLVIKVKALEFKQSYAMKAKAKREAQSKNNSGSDQSESIKAAKTTATKSETKKTQ